MRLLLKVSWLLLVDTHLNLAPAGSTSKLHTSNVYTTKIATYMAKNMIATWSTQGASKQSPEDYLLHNSGGISW